MLACLLEASSGSTEKIWMLITPTLLPLPQEHLGPTVGGPTMRGIEGADRRSLQESVAAGKLGV